MGSSIMCGRTQKNKKTSNNKNSQKKVETITNTNKSNRSSSKKNPELKIINEIPTDIPIDLKIKFYYIKEDSQETVFKSKSFMNDMRIQKLKSMIEKEISMENEDITFYYEDKQFENNKCILSQLSKENQEKKFEIELFCTTPEKKILIINFIQDQTKKYKKQIIMMTNPINQYIKIFKSFFEINKKFDMVLFLEDGDVKLEENKLWQNYKKIDNFSKINLEVIITEEKEIGKLFYLKKYKF